MNVKFIYELFFFNNIKIMIIDPEKKLSKSTVPSFHLANSLDIIYFPILVNSL